MVGNMVLGPTFDRIASVRIHLLTSESTFGGASCICTAHGQLLHSSKLAVEMLTVLTVPESQLKDAMKGHERPGDDYCNSLLLFCSDSGKFWVRWLEPLRLKESCIVLHIFRWTGTRPAPEKGMRKGPNESQTHRWIQLRTDTKLALKKTGTRGGSLGRVPVLTIFSIFWYIKSRYPRLANPTRPGTNEVTACYKCI